MSDWRQTRPIEAGIYLRSNPPISHIVRQDVFIGLKPGVLLVSNPEGTSGTPVSELSDRFWWYGPIPQPPWRAELAVGGDERGGR